MTQTKTKTEVPQGDRFQFRGVQLHTPVDNLFSAIGLIQAQVLAADSGLNPEVVFGSYHARSAPLDVALSLLVPLLDLVEDGKWHDDERAQSAA